MKFTVLTNTPAHVHLYKHAVRRLEERGHSVLVLGRDYGCTRDLLEYFDLPFEIYGSCGTTKGSLFTSLPGHYRHIVKAVRRFDPDLVFGMGGYAAHAGFVSRTPVVLIIDSEPTSLDHFVSRPFARAILTPQAFQKDLGSKHYEFAGFKETAYIHPDVFEPDPDIRTKLGIGTNEPYVVVRFNAFGSHHDLGKGGFTPTERREFVDRLSTEAMVFVTDEGDTFDFADSPARPFDLHPALLHDALAGADLLVADSQTTVTEAALLGTPTIRSNSWVGEDDMGNFQELAARDLVKNIADFETVLETSKRLLGDPDAKSRWQARRDSYVAQQVNLTEVIVDVAENLGTVHQCEGVRARTHSDDRSEAGHPSTT